MRILKILEGLIKILKTLEGFNQNFQKFEVLNDNSSKTNHYTQGYTMVHEGGSGHESLD